MLHLARAIVEVLSDLVKLAVLFLRRAGAIRVENLALGQQLAAYIERGVEPRRLDHADRVVFRYYQDFSVGVMRS